MSVRFAAARNAVRSPIARVLSRGDFDPPANDEVLHETMSEATVAALRHFGQYGLRAAEVAARNARVAAAAHEHADYAHWLSLCRALDARLADRIVAEQIGQQDRLIG